LREKVQLKSILAVICSKLPESEMLYTLPE